MSNISLISVDSLPKAIEARRLMLLGETWAIQFVNCRQLSGPHVLVEILQTFENLPIKTNAQPLHSVSLCKGILCMGSLELDLDDCTAAAALSHIAQKYAKANFEIEFEMVLGNVQRHAVHCPFTAIGIKEVDGGYELVLRWQRVSVQPDILAAKALAKLF